MQAIFMKIKYGVHFCPLLHLYYHVCKIAGYADSKLILLILQVLLLKTEEVKSSV